MSREIKFRIWDERYKEFRYWGFLNDDMFQGIPTGALTIEYCHQNSQQYIGKKDKNGVDIYEGDTDGLGNVVEFCNGCYCLNGDRLVSDLFEVKGNIYEIR